ncbi:MAG TPA: peptide chain release factor 2 [Acidimicrobiales bacterium]|nr:peptide chain release factor 2 [Acidimicrobiales bacterium]
MSAPGVGGAGVERGELADELAELAGRLEAAEAYLHLDRLRARHSELEAQLADPGLWEEPERARRLSAEYGRVRSDLEELERLRRSLTEARELHDLALEEGEEALEALRPELREALDGVRAALEELELRSLFAGEYDERDAVCEIHAGAGGTDAQDWAEMLLRMYLRWAERHGFGVELDEVSPGQEAGILSATFIVRGRHAYGLLAAERGVHRLVRMSPFDSQHRRQTSFASLEATPFLEDAGDEVEIDERDLRVDTYRSSGAGGQHVNVTDSAVRITHLPTGIVVSCQNERSQHQNKARALQILAAKLAERQRAERRAELSALAGPQAKVEWGNQIRSYVLAPYQLVKDLRTGEETGNVEAVLDGDLDRFMVSYLRWRRGGGAEQPG